MGWYICDDCSQGEAVTSSQAVLYNAIKAVDPWHIVIGALNGDQVFWQWSDYTSYLEPAAPTHGAVIPAGAQPRLQLALDLILWEDYREFDFPATGSAFVPGEIRRGMAFEPIVNCCEAHSLSLARCLSGHANEANTTTLGVWQMDYGITAPVWRSA